MTRTRLRSTFPACDGVADQARGQHNNPDTVLTGMVTRSSSANTPCADALPVDVMEDVDPVHAAAGEEIHTNVRLFILIGDRDGR